MYAIRSYYADRLALGHLGVGLGLALQLGGEAGDLQVLAGQQLAGAERDGGLLRRLLLLGLLRRGVGGEALLSYNFV